MTWVDYIAIYTALASVATSYALAMLSVETGIVPKLPKGRLWLLAGLLLLTIPIALPLIIWLSNRKKSGDNQ